MTEVHIIDSYEKMPYSAFSKLLKQLNFEQVLCTNVHELSNLKARLFVNQEHSLIVYAITLNDVLSRATLYGQVYCENELSQLQKKALAGSGYLKVEVDKIFFGLSVTKNLKAIVNDIIESFRIVPKWTNYEKVCIGFVDNTFENGCGKGVGFSKDTLKKNVLINQIMFEQN